MKVEKGNKIKMEYELGVEGGEVIESSATRGAIEYLHGEGKMLSGLERRIECLTVGEEKAGVIPAEEAYGTEETLPTRTIRKGEFPPPEKVEVGKIFEAKDQDGNTVQFTVVKIEGDAVTVRFAHPLAGKNIRFRVRILEISAAS